MRAKIYLIAILLVISSTAFSQMGSIRAKVLDEDGKPVYMANVTLKTDKIVGGQTTDFDGWFHFKALTPGYYNVEISFVGYHTSIIQKINVTAGRITFLETVILKSEAFMIDGGPTIYADKLIDPEVQGVKLSAKTIEMLPNNKSIGSILQATSSAVQLSSDKKHILVRGSRPTASSYYIDGVKLDDMGSGISGSTIKSIQFFYGGIPAKYGDLTGGCIVIETKSYTDYYYQWLSEQD